MTTKRSELWTKITESLFSKIDDQFIKNFRSPGGANSRLAAWDPYDKSMRYYKFLLFNISRNKDITFFDSYKKIGNTNIGNPIIVKVNDCDIDIDYLFSIEEYIFLTKHLDSKMIRNVVEIGAGFGRTCHALLNLIESIDEYVIIDLPEIIKLSSTYLKKVIPNHFHKIKFVENTNEELIKTLKPDLVINVDSFQEMPVDVIDNYIKILVLNSNFFYTKNPIGKYNPLNVGLPDLKPEQLLDVYNLGFCQDVYDIFDENVLKIGREKYCELYRPDISWKIIAEEPVEIFPYLHNVLYMKSNI